MVAESLSRTPDIIKSNRKDLAPPSVEYNNTKPILRKYSMVNQQHLLETQCAYGEIHGAKTLCVHVTPQVSLQIHCFYCRIRR